MRITNSILARESLTNYQSQMRDLDAARQRASTGIRVNRASDDPVAAAGIMQSSSGLRALEQYKKNLDLSKSRLGLEDSVLTQLTDAMTRGKEIASSQASDTDLLGTRLSGKAEVDHIIDFVKDMANTQFAGSFIFGGQYADTPPFVSGMLDPSKPPSGTTKVEVGAKRFLETNHSAQEAFVDSDVIGSLEALSDALGANDPDAVRTSLTRIDTAFGEVQEVIADLGARQSQLDIAGETIDSLEITLQTFRSDLGDADLSEAVTELVNRQSTLEAAMLTTSKILGLTLTDYL